MKLLIYYEHSYEYIFLLSNILSFTTMALHGDTLTHPMHGMELMTITVSKMKSGICIS